ncbi:hypothetical protein KIH86_15020 [Paenibacillus sp. HN-1]|uniref:hypothetical protein n=1 Tax=Paenibacillus TaxID=44249 RepID=UPI001CA9FD48|nr:MULTISPECIES: hypothetical protein [Paenibacillus]MBY9080514.1 hypothetical protein [Paenibacillus sp. CGMCC 1.18879]MBY9085541.1 hypothetical protein [Paenibacillus sinensis]
MEKSTQCRTHREDTPKIESVAGYNGLPKFAPEQFLERRVRMDPASRGYRPQIVISALSESQGFVFSGMPGEAELLA